MKYRWLVCDWVDVISMSESSLYLWLPACSSSGTACDLHVLHKEKLFARDYLINALGIAAVAATTTPTIPTERERERDGKRTSLNLSIYTCCLSRYSKWNGIILWQSMVAATAYLCLIDFTNSLIRNQRLLLYKYNINITWLLSDVAVCKTAETPIITAFSIWCRIEEKDKPKRTWIECIQIP